MISDFWGPLYKILIISIYSIMMHAFMDPMRACMGDFILLISVMLVRDLVQCKPTASLKEMMSSQCVGLLEGGALTSDATRKSVMPTAASVVDSHSGLSSRA